eukprot:CAMPEP_0169224532 /NCGR_PEP_ID=MMETSP1016-20121227/22718_1 /TAXON_ID=342587 /ORGANISM="Karlodinium micrum, Strain CCMP2283" /LENGTH=176 /DNA_ID=CAMNT_0009302985 /DNA_START=55 /DNA_END=586 /DNA_ORIENTATION=+
MYARSRLLPLRRGVQVPRAPPFCIGAAVRASSSSNSPYEVIGVPREATDDAIKEAYRMLVKELHPDVGTWRADALDTGAQEVAEMNERFKELQAAWYVLGDGKRRKEFDEHGTLAAAPTKMSSAMWARLRLAKPEDATLMPNWGPEEPPLWLIIIAPFSVLVLALFGLAGMTSLSR